MLFEALLLPVDVGLQALHVVGGGLGVVEHVDQGLLLVHQVGADHVGGLEGRHGAVLLGREAPLSLLVHALGLRHVWTRILSVYGPNDGEKTLITYLIRSLLGGECPKATKGEQIWDYLYSADAARALRLIGERGRDGGIYLVASGKERRLSDYMAELLSEVAPGGSIDLGAVPYGERQVMHLAADITETTRDTGFVPEISFAEGVRRMAEEMRASLKQDT